MERVYWATDKRSGPTSLSPLYHSICVIYRIKVTLWDDSIIPNWGNPIILTGFTHGIV